ncbi:MAG: three-Cys-motif partner protein TcmP [Desulfobacterales bacterium]|nr:three-Cys-motif partner protein TcmP [Desulfobacterales bacterium]
MPTIDLHRSGFDAGTQTKLEIFEKYLEAWLPTFINNPKCKSVYICDFFAGPGKDLNGNPGSPLIILDVIKQFEDSIREKGLRINILFNELKKEKFNNLQSEVNEKFHKCSGISSLINVRYENEAFDKLFQDMSDQLRGECNLFFIDQNGIKHMTANRIIELEQFPRTDYLFFSASSYLKRFEFLEYFPDLEIGSEIRNHDMHRHLCDYYLKKIGPNGKTMLYPFTIKKGNIYGLIFGSKHVFGADKFLKIAWGKNPLNGEANFDIDQEEGQIQYSLFELPKIKKVNQFKRNLKDWVLNKKIVTNSEIYFYTIRKGFIPTFANNALKELRDEKKLDYFSHSLISYENVCKKKKIINFKVI